MQSKWNPLYKRLIGRFRPDPIALTQPALEEWFEGDLGRYVLGKERELVKQLPKLPGYHLMELGVTRDCVISAELDNLHRFCISPVQNSGVCSVAADFDALPLPSDIIDVAVVHHALEFSPRPHNVLSEITRVVAPGGHIVLFVFNPFSVFGVRKWLNWLFTGGNTGHIHADRKHIWRHHSLRLGRLVDWLRLLNFRTVHVGRGGIGSLHSGDTHVGFGKRRGYGLGLPVGMFYTIVARKHVARPIVNPHERWNGLKVPNLGWQQPIRRVRVKKEKA